MPVARNHLDPQTEHCLELCKTLHDACLHTVHESLKRGGPYASARHINLLLDCATITHTTRDLLLRHSELHEVATEACAVICLACAKTCDHAADDDLAALSRRCASACRPARAVA